MHENNVTHTKYTSFCIIFSFNIRMKCDPDIHQYTLRPKKMEKWIMSWRKITRYIFQAFPSTIKHYKLQCIIQTFHRVYIWELYTYTWACILKFSPAVGPGVNVVEGNTAGLNGIIQRITFPNAPGCDYGTLQLSSTPWFPSTMRQTHLLHYE